nr:peptide-N-glycosidase F-related protein [Flavobacteriales bacterium]
MNKLFLLLAFLCSVAYSQNDTIKVRSHNQTDLSEHGAYDQTVIFPQENSYEKILMNFTMGCASGGCSDWDYTVSVYLMEPTGTSDLEKFELARLITPYGSYMDGSQSSDPNNLFDDSWEHSYIFDVTDFAPLLRDSSSIRVYYDGWSSGFSATVDFDFIQGTPAREVLGIENMYPVNEYSYRSLADDENYPAITRTFDENVKGVAIKSYISGHKHEGPQNCCEWVPKQHSIAINGSNIYQWYVW